jgi:hypothetical protein
MIDYQGRRKGDKLIRRAVTQRLSTGGIAGPTIRLLASDGARMSHFGCFRKHGSNASARAALVDHAGTRAI